MSIELDQLTAGAQRLSDEGLRHDAFHDELPMSAPGTLGGRYLRQFCVGIGEPRNAFSLAAGAHRSVLLAGGIGITPLLCMAETLHHEGGEFELHYSECRHRADHARAANRATGTFYVHFANKLALLKAMLGQFREELAQSGLDQPEHHYQAALGVLRALWSTHHRHAATFRALVEAAAAHPEMAAMYEELRRYARSDFVSTLRSAPQRRDEAPEDLALTAAALENMVNSCLYEWHAFGQRPEGYSKERAFEAILGIVLAIIGGSGTVETP